MVMPVNCVAQPILYKHLIGPDGKHVKVIHFYSHTVDLPNSGRG